MIVVTAAYCIFGDWVMARILKLQRLPFDNSDHTGAGTSSTSSFAHCCNGE
jgi:hypothetical protein